MKELRCPKCGSVFTVDEDDYASIVSQVKNAEFEAELRQRLEEIRLRNVTEQQLLVAKSEKVFEEKMRQKDQETGARLSELLKIKSEREAEIVRLQSTIAQNEANLKLAVLQERTRAQQSVQEKDAVISQLRASAELEKRESQIHEAALQRQHEETLRLKDDQINYYKDLKTKMSTKMVGETLEQHCSIQFEQYVRPMMPTAYFDKDNDASEGSKGDFIFRDSEDGVEYISIMFEMKNEMETTASKHKNEDFLKKLDEDRRKKGCEFAVLVSLLEADNELYNTGIVNKSHLYPKMYVIRPQFFVPFINLLVQTSKKSLEYKRQLQIAQSKEVDVTNFEKKILDFRDKFGRHYEFATKKFDAAISDIDATITKLQKIRDELVGSENYLRLATQDTEDLTIRKLTYKNPTMKAKFEEARAAEGKSSDDLN